MGIIIIALATCNGEQPALRKKEILFCMFGLPDIKDIVIGSVVVVIIIMLLCRLLRFNPESGS